MPESSPTPVDEPVDEAMHAVLEREAQARDAIAACERRAAAMLDAAERQARAIVERTDRRITSIRLRSEAATQAAVSAVLARDAGEHDAAAASERQRGRLEKAVRRLAARLAGGDEAGDGARR